MRWGRGEEGEGGGVWDGNGGSNADFCVGK